MEAQPREEFAFIGRLRKKIDQIGLLLVEAFHLLALFAIGAIIVWAAVQAFLSMINKGHVTVEDILLLFIYLELGAMVGIYFKTARLPVRFLIYIAITALTRMMIGFINVDHTPTPGLLLLAGTILLLTLAGLVLRIGTTRFPVDTGLAELSDFTHAGPGDGKS
ncbi:MAG TPA: phosphate-starvation-inducible protein PsiE [Rhodobacteraceae bacterium]|nr:phosphate-starvation-inducible protein PsiE [Paracoccaceae bacterium]